VTCRHPHLAEFVLWWDTEAERTPAKHAGPGRGNKTSPQNGSGFIHPEDFGLTVKLISKWRTNLIDRLQAAFEARR